MHQDWYIRRLSSAVATVYVEHLMIVSVVDFVLASAALGVVGFCAMQL
jgi:hypothetical protein